MIPIQYLASAIGEHTVHQRHHIRVRHKPLSGQSVNRKRVVDLHFRQPARRHIAEQYEPFGGSGLQVVQPTLDLLGFADLDGAALAALNKIDVLLSAGRVRETLRLCRDRIGSLELGKAAKGLGVVGGECRDATTSTVGAPAYLPDRTAQTLPDLRAIIRACHRTPPRLAFISFL